MGSFWRAALLSGCAILGGAAPARAQSPEQAAPAVGPAAQRSAKAAPAASAALTWRSVTTPATGESRSIGDYSAGCLQGAVALPLAGEGYQVAHPERHRYFGHPDLLDFLRSLGHRTAAAKLASVLLGDLAQPRGGPAPGGHSSHQTGLDVDIWYWSPASASAAPLPAPMLSGLSSRSVLDPKQQTLAARFTERVAALLHFTASDPRVTRIFVHPLIKRALCAATHDDRAWLGKLRPWFGHDDHFHVRLGCPPGSPECISQPALQPGDGCESVDWWLSPQAATEREEERKRYHGKVVHPLQLPPRCASLLAERAAPRESATGTASAATAPSVAEHAAGGL